MSKCWRVLPLFLLAASTFASHPSFENTAIVRTVELGGSVVHVTTTFALKSLEDGLKTYTVALGRHDKARTSWLEAKVKGQKATLQVEEKPFDADRCVVPTSHLPSMVDES
jgi:oligosaccharyltransferase complex subunit alpha (ribophorin I)